MGHNMKYQMTNAIDKSFVPGESKRTSDEIYKKEHIFSYQYRSKLKDIASDFSKYMKDNYSDVKMLRDIKTEHLQSYLDSKSSRLSDSSLQAYKSALEKIGLCASNVYRSKIDMSIDYKIEARDKIRDISMERKDYDALIKSTMDKNCQSRQAVIVCREFGLRVSEVVKIQPRDINFKANTLYIHQAKGGRERTLEIRTFGQREALKGLLDYNRGTNKNILSIKPDSINKWLQSNMKKIGISKYADNKTGVHAIRKLYAEERYLGLKASGLEHKKAWGIVSVELGHSANRLSLFKTYCPTLN